MDESSKTEHHAPSLSLPYGVIKTLRETLILNAIRHFNPDVVFVQAARDARGEILSGLNYLQETKPETRVVEGRGGFENTTAMMRDVLAGPVTNLPCVLFTSGESCEAGQYRDSLTGRDSSHEMATAA